MPYQYIAYALIKQILKVDSDEAEDILSDQLQQLTELGWIKQAQTQWKETTQKGWQMHPVIQDMLQQQLVKDEEFEESICMNVYGLAWADCVQNPIEAQVWQVFLERLITCIKTESKAIMWIHNGLASLHKAMESYNVSLQQRQIALQIGEKMLSPKDPSLVNLYMNMGNICHDLTNYDVAINYFEKSKAICEKLLPPTHSDLALLYMNIEIAYISYKLWHCPKLLRRMPNYIRTNIATHSSQLSKFVYEYGHCI